MEKELDTELSFRQKIQNEIYNLDNDFKLLYVLSEHHELSEVMKNIIKKKDAMIHLLSFYPKRCCINCNHPLN